MGHDLWRRMTPDRRDFFLPRLDASMGFFTGKVATSSDLAAMSSKTLQLVRVPAYNEEEDTWHTSDELFFAESQVACLSGHSERATLPSVLAALGVARGDREHLGRWTADGD